MFINNIQRIKIKIKIRNLTSNRKKNLNVIYVEKYIVLMLPYTHILKTNMMEKD